MLSQGNRYWRWYSKVTIKAITVFIAGFSVLAGNSISMAQDNPADACEEAARLMREDNDLVGALEEAKWCVEALEQLKENQALAVFPDEVGAFAGGETSQQNTFGISLIERTYTGGSESIKLTLTGGGGAASGLAALAQLGAELGVQGGTKTRIQRRTVIDMSAEDDGVLYMVQLRSGGLLNVTSESASKETVLEFLKEFPIAELDDALKE